MGIFGGIPPSSSGSYYFPGASSSSIMGSSRPSMLGSAISTGASILPGPQPDGQVFSPAMQTQLNAITVQEQLDSARSMQTAGLIAQVGGVITQEIANYYAAKQAQYEAKSKASSMRLQAYMADINASMMQEDAASILEAGQQQKAQLTMRAGMEMAQELTRQGARGVRIGAGSAAETQASLDLVKEIDAYNIDSNALRQSQSRRMQAVNMRSQGQLGRASAQNIEESAPRTQTLLGTAGRVGSEFFLYRAAQAGRDINRLTYSR